MKILLVEDEEMLNGITAKYLRAENMTVDTCCNGQQANWLKCVTKVIHHLFYY